MKYKKGNYFIFELTIGSYFKMNFFWVDLRQELRWNWGRYH